MAIKHCLTNIQYFELSDKLKASTGQVWSAHYKTHHAIGMTKEEAEERLILHIRSTIDGRDTDYTRPHPFDNHNCGYCGSGERPCVQGNPRMCEYPHARND